MKLEDKPVTDRFLLHGPVTDGGSLMTPDRAALWWIALDRIADDDWETLEAILSEEERIRSERFHFDRDRQVYVAAHATCRGLLSYCLGGAPQSWRFSVGDHGKPELVCPPEGPRVRVNISHTRGLAAVALTLDHDIGVDVEWLQRSAETDKLAKRVFAARECRTLAAAPQARKLDTFLSFWTLKEAYVKAIGKGLSQPLDAFSFDLDTLRIHFEDGQADDPARWRFERYAPAPEHLMALAIRHPDPARLSIDAMAAPLDFLLAQGA
ncbi:4'-phosphopantetheinyl transferase superfamily protein [Labrenzia sp. 011]|uniref:4'-phosphopantetheinyl transferase family protein n=1 Tax=Labrenzia sp. 011 TaxID=2171494 RepID=UPI000D50BAD0|nr:4'-phosphopantetheinyl transferase superfamily protein [Labrenzia sp. 011]PVB62188.1 phosphopantetheinyl transferase [Labrenzia sp. 011]